MIGRLMVLAAGITLALGSPERVVGQGGGPSALVVGAPDWSSFAWVDGDAPLPPPRQQIGRRPPEGDFAPVAAAAAAFGAMGALAGGLVGAAIYQGNGEDGDLWAALQGAAVGAWVGGGFGGGMVSGRPGRALAGSALGVVGGIMMLSAGRDRLGLVLGPLTHGLITATATRIGS